MQQHTRMCTPHAALKKGNKIESDITCIIQHFCHSLPIFHMLPFHHLILYQPFSFSLSSTIPMNLNKKCSTSSTSPLCQFLHNLSSLLTPHRLPVSISKPALPPLSFVRILLFFLHFTSTQRALHPFSISFHTSPNLE